MFGNDEKERRENFDKNYEAFAKLEEMQRQDKNIYFVSIERFGSFKGTEKDACSKYKQNNVEHDFCYEFKHDQGLSSERFIQYKNLLNQANLYQIVYQFDEPKKRHLRFHQAGLNDSGYTYMEYPPPKYFNSFKECKPIMPSNSCFVYLRKNWYMYRENFRLEQESAK